LPKRTLFHLLVERPWWFSLVVAAGVYLVFGMFSGIVGAAAAIPFIGIALYCGWLRIRNGPAADPVLLIRALRLASAEKVAAVLREAYTKQGYEIGDTPDGDMMLDRNGYKTLLRYRRWRAQSTGTAAIDELAATMKKRGADRGIHVTIGVFADAATDAAYAAAITPLDGGALTGMLRFVRGAHKLIDEAAEAETE
jgi:hypothetical protein